MTVPETEAPAHTRLAYEAVKDRIASGAVTPGDWLREHTVATSLGLSRTPVREALRLLAAEGVVELVHNRGARVVDWTPDDIDEAYRLRALIEGYGAGLAARRADGACVTNLRALQDRYERALTHEQRDVTPAECNNDFHAAVLAASGSARLSTLLAAVSSAPLVHRVLRGYGDDDRRRSVLAHRDIITAVENGDEHLATAAMSSHILAARYSALRPAVTGCVRDPVAADRSRPLRRVGLPTHHVHLTTSGRAFAGRGDGARTVRVRRTDGAEQLVLTIPRTRLESHLADLIGHPVAGPVDFDLGFSTSSPRGRSLLAAVEFLAGELDRDGGITASAALAREQLEAFVMTQVLLAVPHSYTDRLEGRVVPSRPSRLQAVLAHLETHADQPLTPGQLARVGCMSVRALHAAFRDELGVSPMAYLRRVRLDRVHADLLRGAEPQRIGDVALRWGFFHPSRFARQYKERFGELPSDTARRRP